MGKLDLNLLGVNTGTGSDRMFTFQYLSMWLCLFITSRVSGRGHRIGPISVCVCVSLSTLTAKPFDL